MSNQAFTEPSSTRVFAGSGGLRIVASTFGAPDAPPVLFSHGGGQTRHSWGAAMTALGEAGFYAVSLDLRGHGDSDWDPEADYSLDTYTADLEAVTRAIGRPAALVGASLGGLTSLILASRDHSITALVLVDVVPQLEPEGISEIGAFMTANPNGFSSLEEAADSIAAYIPHRKRPRNVSGLKKNLRERNGRFYWHWDPAMMVGAQHPDPAVLRVKLDEAARRVACPTLLIRGRLSRVVSPAGVAAFRALIPSAEFVDIAGADHMVAGDANDAFNAPLIDFLQRKVKRNTDPAASASMDGGTVNQQ